MLLRWIVDDPILSRWSIYFTLVVRSHSFSRPFRVHFRLTSTLPWNTSNWELPTVRRHGRSVGSCMTCWERISQYTNHMNHMGVSLNGGFSPQIINLNNVFHYQTIHFLLHPYFWKHPIYVHIPPFPRLIKQWQDCCPTSSLSKKGRSRAKTLTLCQWRGGNFGGWFYQDSALVRLEIHFGVMLYTWFVHFAISCCKFW